jgi:hypothetical protein
MKRTTFLGGAPVYGSLKTLTLPPGVKPVNRQEKHRLRHRFVDRMRELRAQGHVFVLDKKAARLER